MNRDYFTRPIQSDRTSYGYGRTDLAPPASEPWYVSLALWLAVLAVPIVLWVILP